MFNKKFHLKLSLKQFEKLTYKHGITNGVGKWKKGHIPWSKGKKCIWGRKYFRSKYPLGTERINKEGFVEIKTSYHKHYNYERKHVVIWEKANGKIPKGHVVIFADKNRQNFDLNNLMLISRAELAVMNRNGFIFNNIDLTKTGKVIADLIMAIAKRRKKK